MKELGHCATGRMCSREHTRLTVRKPGFKSSSSIFSVILLWISDLLLISLNVFIYKVKSLEVLVFVFIR